MGMGVASIGARVHATYVHVIRMRMHVASYLHASSLCAVTIVAVLTSSVSS